MKNNNDTDKNLRNLQLIELDILDEVVKICEKYNLRYYLIGGTLIGAVRHKGFIPWDDDIDIAMPRSDYDRFIKIANKNLKEPYEIFHHSTNKECREWLLKVINTSVEVTEKKVNITKTNVWIDILPIDGIPNHVFSRTIYKIKFLYSRMLMGFINIEFIRDKDRNFLEKLLIGFGKKVPIGKKLDRKKLIDKTEKYIRKYEYEKCKYVGTFFGYYGFHEIVPKSNFGNGSTVEFEGKKYSAPENVDAYLTHMYGDYMKLPPEEERIGHHIISVKKIKGN